MLTVDIEKIPFYQDGLKKGIQKTLEKVVIGMLKLNADVDFIHKSTGVSVEEIEEIRKELS